MACNRPAHRRVIDESSNEEVIPLAKKKFINCSNFRGPKGALAIRLVLEYRNYESGLKTSLKP